MGYRLRNDGKALPREYFFVISRALHSLSRSVAFKGRRSKPAIGELENEQCRWNPESKGSELLFRRDQVSRADRLDHALIMKNVAHEGTAPKICTYKSNKSLVI